MSRVFLETAGLALDQRLVLLVHRQKYNFVFAPPSYVISGDALLLPQDEYHLTFFTKQGGDSI